MVFQAFSMQLIAWLQAARRGQGGQALVEYSLMIALIAIAAIGGLTAFQVSSDHVYDKVTLAADAIMGSLK